jgi:hypothetical protein
MRSILLSILAIGSLFLAGCQEQGTPDPSNVVVSEKAGTYDNRTRGIGASGDTFTTPPPMSVYQEINVVCKHGTIVYWSPLLGWSSYHEKAAFMIPPGTTLHLGITPDEGWTTYPDIIDVTYSGTLPQYVEWCLAPASNG